LAQKHVYAVIAPHLRVVTGW